MSILSALKQQNSSIDDLAALPQAMIMQMAQKKQIDETMLAPILARKAEMADAVARTRALQSPGQAQPTVMEQLMATNAQAEQPQMPEMAPQMPQQMPQGMPQDAGVSQLPIPERQYAGGGIIAFADGGMSEEDYEDYEDKVRKSKRESVFNEMMFGLKNLPSRASDMISGMPRSYEASRQQPSMNEVSDIDQARKFNVGNLRPSGFSYPGQVGISKGGFAMFDSPEAGIKALQQDISIKLNRGLDTPHKFISVYAPESDKNDVKTYSRNVANMLGIGSNDKIPNTPEARQLLAQAITRQEGAHKATAAFAQGGEIRHFDDGGYTELGIPMVTSPDMGSYNTIVPGTPENLLNNKQITPEEYEKMKKKQAPKKQETPTANNQPATNDYPYLQRAPIATTPEQDYLAEIRAENKAARAELKKSAAEDKNLALMAAGLRMIGGSSPYASVNIGNAGAAGVEQYGASKARRAAELAALNKSDIGAFEAGELGKYRQSVMSSNERARLSDDYRLAEKNITDRANNFLVKNNPRFNMLPDDQKSALLQQEINRIKQQDPYFQGLSQQLGIQPMPAMQQNRTINFSNIK